MRTLLSGPGGSADRVTVLARVAVGAVVLGLAGVLVFGGLWLTATRGERAEVAAAREGALGAARQIAVNLQTLDHSTVDTGMDIWMASATGPLLEELTKNRAQYVEQIRKVRTTTSARLVDAALADLDPASGRARVIAAVDVNTSQTLNGTPTPAVGKQVRIQLELVRTPDAGWKAAAASAIRS